MGGSTDCLHPDGRGEFMLPLKTLLYLALFGCAVLMSVVKHPIIGMYAYLVTYNINPMGQWWGRYLPGFAQRYSFWISLAIILGIIFNYSKLRFRKLIETQELLLILFMLVIWLSVFIGQGSGIGYNVIKMTKVTIVLLMASHLITTRRYFQGMIWVFLISGFYLGYELYSGSGRFYSGRFHAGVGGSDFGEGNFLAAHFGFLLPFVGIMLLKGSWKVRAFSVVAAVFMVNSIILTQSRGIFIGLAAGIVVASFYSTMLRGHRKKIVALVLVGLVGAYSLTHPGYWQRIATIQADEDFGRDRSAEGRLDAWKGAWLMAQDYPLGVGVGHFFFYIGDYAPTMEGKDTHNTYLRCLAELGFHGLLVLLLMIFTSFLILRDIDRKTLVLDSDKQEFYQLNVFAIRIALTVYLTAAMFISSVYIEEMYWLLMMPVFLKRALENEAEENQTDLQIRQAVAHP